MPLPIQIIHQPQTHINTKPNMPSMNDLVILSILIYCFFELICSIVGWALLWLDVVRLLVEQNGWMFIRFYEALAVRIAMVRLEAYHGYWIMVA